MIEAFIHLVNGYEREAKLSAKESVYQAKTAAVANLKAAGQVLRDSAVSSGRRAAASLLAYRPCQSHR
jgi:hypothetical protein